MAEKAVTKKSFGFGRLEGMDGGGEVRGKGKREWGERVRRFA